MKLKAWSRKFPACRVCGTWIIKHRGNGLCYKCYWKDYFIKNRTRVLQNLVKYRYFVIRKIPAQYHEEYIRRVDYVILNKQQQKTMICELCKQKSFDPIICLTIRLPVKLPKIIMLLCKKCYCSRMGRTYYTHKTCRNGHQYTKQNIYFYKSKELRIGVKRLCRICLRVRRVRHREKKKLLKGS